MGVVTTVVSLLSGKNPRKEGRLLNPQEEAAACGSVPPRSPSLFRQGTTSAARRGFFPVSLRNYTGKKHLSPLPPPSPAFLPKVVITI